MRSRLAAARCPAAWMRRLVFPVAVLSLTFSVAGWRRAAQASDSPPGLPDPGKLVAIVVETGRQPGEGRAVPLRGRDATQQLLVTGQFETGQQRDLTRSVHYEAVPAGIVAVDATGLVTPLAEGQATIRVEAAPGIEASLAVEVTHLVQDLPVHFPNQITPLFTKYGCNGGGCHGKSGGQNGFRLSLLGFEPREDYEYLVKEGRGRRLFPAAPDQSLLLLKATARLPHGGGQRIEYDSPAYRLMRRWIEQGMPYGQAGDPQVVSIEVLPAERRLGRQAAQQLVVVAHYSDGSTEDVTRTTQFDSNDPEMAEVSPTGLVTTGTLSGTVAVMARYQGHVGVFRATIPLGAGDQGLPVVRNLVDEHVHRQLQLLGLPASPLCDDATFLRRVTIDLAGRLPTLAEAEAFLADPRPDKRAAVIDRLLDSGDYADYFANKWAAVLRNKRRQDNEKPATFAFHEWIRQSLYENKPYDQFVREILTATGEPGENPPAGWYREVKDAAAQLEDTAQLFLGLRIQCARCHHHPFEKWSQHDYYGFAAFFAQVGRKRVATPGEERIFHRVGIATAQHPKTGEAIRPTGLGGKALEIPAHRDPRHALVDWMAARDNPFFARALVNRYWKHFFGRGIVDPEDDMRVTNPASNPQLLDALAHDFVEHSFDLKHLIRTICNSATYQLAAEPNAWNRDDKQNFSRFYPRRLHAEVLLDAIDQVTGAKSTFSGVPAAMRAVQLPDSGFNSYFLTVFGRPEAASACECERSSDANLAQSLHLLNSGEIQGKLTASGGQAARLAADTARPHEAKVRELYLLAFSRPPTAEETAVALAHIQKYPDKPQQAYEDIIWALINTKEFLFNH